MNILSQVLMLKGIDQAAMVAGFLLANSADNLSYVDEVKVLTPISICLKNDQFHPKLHTGKSQTEAVVLAKEELAANQSKCDSWAFAREGVLDEKGLQIHTISVSAWSTGMNEPVVFIQRFARTPKFRLDGEPIIGIAEIMLDTGKASSMLNVLRKGISLHEDGGPKWDSWH